MNEVLIDPVRTRQSGYFSGMRWIFFLMVLLAGPLQAEPVRILAVGDSIMAWHKWTGRDIPARVGALLGARVENAAVPGARFSNASGFGRAVGFDVRAQYRSGPWDVVVINGGANDLLTDCGCGDCDDVLDNLITADLTGEVPAFLASVQQSGAQIVWMG